MIYKLVPFHTIGHYVAQNADNHHSTMLEEKTEASPRIDWEYFLTLSQQGQCIASVMQVDNEVRGYSVFVLGNDTLYKDRLEATNQALYIEPEFRSHTQEFLKETNKLFKDLGVQSINYILGNERLGKLMSRVGFKDKYTVWSVDYE